MENMTPSALGSEMILNEIALKCLHDMVKDHTPHAQY
jgi:hypothetical protein